MLRVPLRLVPPQLRVPIVQGRLKGKWWIAGSGVHGYWLGSYEWEKRAELERTIASGATVFDVGANVGYYTLLASELVGPHGTVVSLEPLPRNLRYLRRHLEMNHVCNVRVFGCAAWDSTGTVCFQLGADPSMGRADESTGLQVEALRLDDLVAEYRLSLPDVIKMDIEGNELRALRGARSILTNGRPTIFLATHGPDVHKACCEFLMGLGYDVQPLRLGALEDVDEVVARKPALQ